MTATLHRRLARTARVSVIPFLVLTLATHIAHAQGSFRLSLDPGTDVRLRTRAAPATTIRGRVHRMSGDTLVLRPENDQPAAQYLLPELDRLEIRGGENKRRGMAIGGGIAAGITAVFGGIDVAKGNISRDDFVGTMLVNSLIGILLGYAFAPKGWEALPLPSR